MSNEVKRFSPEYCEAGGVGWAEMQEDAEGAWCKASDYAALEAECDKWHQQFNCMQLQRDHHRDKAKALAAELAAIRAEGGEQVEVVAHFLIPRAGSHAGERFAKAGIPSDSLNSELYTTEPLMTVAQHQRIVAAMAAELADAKSARDAYAQNAIDLQKQRDALRAELERVRQGSLFLLDAHAELEAARKQEPVAYVLFRDGEVCYESDDSIVISNTPGDETDLYKWLPVFTIPPLAGKVSVPRELLQTIEQSWRVPNGWPKSVPDHAAEKIESGLRELRALLATPSMEVKHGD